jgi:hypothetical protein
MKPIMDTDEVIIRIKKTEDIFEKAKLIDSIVFSKSMSIKDLAARIKMTSAYVCHYMRFSKIPDLIKDGYYDNTVSMSHLIILSRLKSHVDMVEVYEQIILHNLTTYKTEELVREKLYGIKSIGEYITNFEKEQLSYNLKKMLRPALIDIIQSRTKSKLVIEFKGSLVVTSAHIRKLFQAIDGTLTKS